MSGAADALSTHPAEVQTKVLKWIRDWLCSWFYPFMFQMLRFWNAQLKLGQNKPLFDGLFTPSGSSNVDAQKG